MVLGALLDTGIKKELLLKELKQLKVNGYTLKTKKVKSRDLSSTFVDTKIPISQPNHRSFTDIKNIIEKSSLSTITKEKSMEIFKCLARAESKIHNTSIKKVHFHEVGSLDNIIQVVGSIICLELLGIKKILCSPINLGKGQVKCSHGILPVPAPATAEILRNKPVYTNEIDFELATPTGAAIVTTLANEFCSLPKFKIKNTGYGAGNKYLTHQHVLRVLIGKEIKCSRRL